MSVINFVNLNKKSYICDENNPSEVEGELEIVGKLRSNSSNAGTKIIKKFNFFKGGNSIHEKNNTEILENLKNIASYYQTIELPSSLPLYSDVVSSSDFKFQKEQRNIDQLISNTFLLANKENQRIISKLYYNSFNYVDNPVTTSFSDKKIKVLMSLSDDSRLVEQRKNSSLLNTTYNSRRSSIVSSVINDLQADINKSLLCSDLSLKQSMCDQGQYLKISRNSSLSSNESASIKKLTANHYNVINTKSEPKNQYGEYNNCTFSTLEQKPQVSETKLSMNSPALNFKNQKLNIEYETALNTDPSVVVLPSVVCKNPSEDGQRHRDLRRLSLAKTISTQANEIEIVNIDNNGFTNSDTESDMDDTDLENNGLLRINSLFSENASVTSNSDLKLTGKKHLLRGSVTIENTFNLPCLLINNFKVMLCGYKLQYDHFVLQGALEKDIIYENIIAETESLNGLRITKPFIKKEVNFLQDRNYTIVVNKKTFEFEILIDSREFPSTLNCQFGKIEYRLECYINAINIGNIILNNKIVIIKSLEPSMSNLINQNDSVLRHNSFLTVFNKVLEGHQWKIRYKQFNYKKESLSLLLSEDEYLDSSSWEKMLLKDSSIIVQPKIMEQLQKPKLLYDLFLVSKTIVLNEPFEFYFKIKHSDNCVNDWNITECSMILEQHYVFPYTSKLDENHKKCKSHKMKYKKVFSYTLVSRKYDTKSKTKDIYIPDLKVQSDLAIYDSVFHNHQDVGNNHLLDRIVPHYDELNTLYPETNKLMKNIISISHRIKINFSVETKVVSGLKEKRLKKQFSISLPVFLITSYTLSTMTLPLYEE
ncbi:hypothetical protein QEN19_000435 [Hanseniaspora menglaensis]